MEQAVVLLDHAGDGKRFDERLAESREANAPEINKSVQIIQKKGATTGGRSAVMITFDVAIDGKRVPVQTVMTAHSFLMAASAVKGAVADEV